MKSLPDSLPVSQLLLDPENPRLPENLLGAAQDEILIYLFENDQLDELAESMTLNGFFANEPLVVLPPEADGKRIVVEGNRRLATLLILLQEPVAIETGLQFNLGAASSATIPLAVPAFEVEDREEVVSYLGFRHINGIRTWGASEKARFVWGLVNTLSGETDPFYSAGRRIGSNSRGVRSSYIAYALLQSASIHSAEPSAVEFVVRKRFGVWFRLLGTRNVLTAIKLDRDANSFRDVQQSLKSIDIEEVVQIVRDLAPRDDAIPPVLADSRNVTAYSDVLGDESARRVLRETNNLPLARSVLDQADFDKQLSEAVAKVDLLLDMATTSGAVSRESEAQAARLSTLARSLLGAIRELSKDDGED